MPGAKVRFAIVGVDHNHAYNHARLLLNAGAELAAVYSDEPDDVEAFKARYPDCPVTSMEAILEDRTIDVIGGSAKPADRAAISVKAMQHGKDVVADKPAVITWINWPKSSACSMRAAACGASTPTSTGTVAVRTRRESWWPRVPLAAWSRPPASVRTRRACLRG